MAWSTLAATTDVRAAGNISERVEDATLIFYLELASFFLYSMIGSTNYSDAKAGSLDSPVNKMLTKAEALIAVSFALPAVSLHISDMGAVKQMAMARGGEYQVLSYAKEIQELASNYMVLARTLIPDSYISSENFDAVWHCVAMTVFPGLDEYPTRGTIKSWAEALIQEYRGDIIYTGENEGID